MSNTVPTYGNIHAKPTRQVCFVVRPHGFEGWIRLQTEQEFSLITQNRNRYLLVELHGQWVPFQVNDFNQQSGICKLDGIDDEKTAEALSGLPIMSFGENSTEINEEIPELQGYTLIREGFGEFGTVERVLEMPGHYLLEIKRGDKLLLAPFHEDLVARTDHENKILEMILPDGIESL
jgi:16S rRNA processing protein RimM